MSGPLLGKTKVKMYGTGFSSTKEEVFFKWGVIDTEKEAKDAVGEYIWSESDFVSHAMVDGSEILSAYKKEAFNVEKKDSELTDGETLKTYVGKAPRLWNFNRTHGGPIYISVG
jgi:hypothetical protein